MTKKSKLTQQEIEDILAVVQAAYAKAGKEINFAALMSGDDEIEDKILIDNRKDEELN